MKASKLKLNTVLVINCLGIIIFILIIVYELFFLDGLYQTLNPPVSISALGHMKRIDQAGLQKALGRYDATQNYAPPAATAADPFAVIVTGVGGNGP